MQKKAWLLLPNGVRRYGPESDAVMSAALDKRLFVRMAPQDRMREIEAAAREVFSQHGYDAASISEIAKRAGIREGTIYKYYENKRELLLTVVQHWYEDLIAGYLDALQDVEGTQAKLRIIIRRHLNAIEGSPDLCRLFVAEVRGAADYHDSRLFELNRQYTRVLMDVLDEGISRGELRPDISRPLVRDIIFGGIESHATAFLADRGGLDETEITDQLTRIVWSGVEASGGER